MTKLDKKMELPKMTTLDDLFTTQDERDRIEAVKEIEIDKIVDFPNHPFKVKEDENLKTMVESIEKMGVLTPVIVRPKNDGTYEMISGHRRKFASQLAEKNN